MFCSKLIYAKVLADVVVATVSLGSIRYRFKLRSNSSECNDIKASARLCIRGLNQRKQLTCESVRHHYIRSEILN